MVACTGGGSSTGIDTSTLSCPPDSTLTYENYGKLVIDENCGSCHTAKQRPRLDTADAIRANRAAIMEAAVATDTMPQGSDMVLDERQTLGEWLACGAP